MVTHIVLDSSIFRSDPRREKAAFRSLTRLASNRLVQIHIPHVVEREFTTHQETQLDSVFGEARRFIASVRKRGLEESSRDIDQIESAIEQLRSKVAVDVARSLDCWAQEVSAEIHHTKPDHTNLVLNAYFSGGPPFSQPKERKDFPDAFIYAIVRDISLQKSNLYFISGDDNLRTCCGKLAGVTTHGSLDEFIKSDVFENAAQDLDHLSKLQIFRDHIHDYSNDLCWHINRRLLEHLPFLEFKDPYFRSPDQIGSIETMQDLEEVDVSESTCEILGVDTLLLPFSCSVRALVYYSMLASDYWALDDNDSLGIVVNASDGSSDHHIEASEEVVLSVSGVVSITFEFDPGVEIADAESAFSQFLNTSAITLEGGLSIQIMED